MLLKQSNSTMKRKAIKWLVVFYTLCVPQFIQAQTSYTAVELSPVVGPFVDFEEKTKYDLFPEIADSVFKMAQFFENKSGEYQIRFYLKNNETFTKNVSDEIFYGYQKQVNKKPLLFNAIDTAYLYTIRLIDETELKVQFLEINKTTVVVNTKYLGEFEIPKSKIVDYKKGDLLSEQGEQRWFPNPHDSRHFFAPTAKNIQKGEGYYQNVYLVLNFFNVGVSNNVLVGGGLSLIPGIGFENQLLFLNTKVGFEVNEKWSLGGGGIMATIPGFENDGTTVLGLPFGVATYGTKNNNLTLGVGYGLSSDSEQQIPIAMLGGMYRISRRLSLATENWLIIADYTDHVEQPVTYDQYGNPIFNDIEVRHHDKPLGVVTYGMRFFSEKLCVDLGFFNLFGEMWDEDNFFPGIPYLDFVVRF